MILPADKGNVTVVLDKIQYEEKMRTLLGNPVYRKINKNPTGYIERKTSKELRELKRKQELDEAIFAKTRPSASRMPMIYGLPKTHKPLRPIV